MVTFKHEKRVNSESTLREWLNKGALTELEFEALMLLPVDRS